MKLRLLDMTTEITTESEQDSATEISNYELTQEVYYLVSQSGMKVNFYLDSVVISKSYIKDSDENTIQYNAPHENTNYRLELFLTEKPIILSRQEFDEYFANYYNKSPEEKNNYPADKSIRFEKFEEHTQFNADNSDKITISSKNGKLLITAIEQAKQNIVIVPEEITQILVDYEEENLTNILTHSETLIARMCDEANARLAYQLEISVQKTLNDLKLNSDKLKP